MMMRDWSVANKIGGACDDQGAVSCGANHLKKGVQVFLRTIASSVKIQHPTAGLSELLIVDFILISTYLVLALNRSEAPPGGLVV